MHRYSILLAILLNLISNFSSFAQEKDTAYWNNKLLDASYEGDEKTILKALLKGANVNTCNWIGVTPLMFAAESNHLDIAKILIYNGADVNAIVEWDEGETPLDYAINQEFTEGIKLLRAHGGKTAAELKAEKK